jgi:glycosyltransferase involved in cell wall biosynthesis
MSKVSVVICTKNSGEHIERVIKSAKAAGALEVIVVDAYSKDGTAMTALKYADKVVFDKGVGLGNARNIGRKAAKGDYVCYMGSDNITPPISGMFDKLATEMELMDWDGIGLKTTIRNPKTYLQHAMIARWKNRIKSGPVDVIGTPFLFSRKLLNSFRFSSTATWSDDTDLCLQLAKAGRSVGYSHRYTCYEVGQDTWDTTRTRFKNYGKGDREFYLRYRQHWGPIRKLKSILHPLVEFKTIKSIKDIVYLPYLTFAIFWRYVGYADI